MALIVEVNKYLDDIGFTGKTKEGLDTKRVARGIIWLESRGDAHAKNPAPCSAHGDHAVGEFQICTPMHMSEADAMNYVKNGQKAKQLYDACGGSFACDWPTFHGPWQAAPPTFPLRNVGDAPPPRGGADAQTGGAAGPAAAVGDNALAAIAPAITGLIKALFDPSGWARVGKGLLGGIVVIIGIAYIGAQALKPVARTARKLPIPVPV